MQDIKHQDVKAYYRTNSADTAGGPEVEMDGWRERMSHHVNEEREGERKRERLKKESDARGRDAARPADTERAGCHRGRREVG